MSAPTQLADGVVRLGTRYVNWYLVADETGVTIIDAGVPGYRPQLEPGLELLGRRLKDVKAILLTHADGDHTGVATAVRDETGTLVHLHAADAESAHNRGKKKMDESMLPELAHLGAYRLFGHFARNGGARPPVLDGTVAGGGRRLDVPGKANRNPDPGHTRATWRTRLAPTAPCSRAICSAPGTPRAAAWGLSSWRSTSPPPPRTSRWRPSRTWTPPSSCPVARPFGSGSAKR